MGTRTIFHLLPWVLIRLLLIAHYMKKMTMMVIAAAVLGSLMLTSTPATYAHNPDGLDIPEQCSPYIGDAVVKHIHSLTIFGGNMVQPGDNVKAEAKLQGNSLVDKVRFLWYDGTGMKVREQIVPRPMPSADWKVDDTFPGVYGPNTEWEVIACFEGQGKTFALKTFHLNVASFFVLPESGLGAIAVVGASLGVLGGYMHLRKGYVNI